LYNIVVFISYIVVCAAYIMQCEAAVVALLCVVVMQEIIQPTPVEK